MKKRALVLLPLAAALLLSGCSEAASDTPAGASKGASAQQLDAATLAEIAGEFAGDNEQAVIIDKEMLKSQIPLAEQARKAMKVTPEACAVFASGDAAEELEKMNIVTVTLPGATPLEGVQMGLASFADRADAEANMAQADEVLEYCSDFSFALQGQETTLNVKGLEATTSAEKTSAIQTTTNVGEITIKTVSVNALEGSNVVTVAVMGGTDTDKDLAAAQKQADAVLQMVAKAGS